MSRSTLFALFALILLSPLGCGGLSPFQPEPLKVTATPYTNYSHVLEWNIATVVTPELKPTPSPSPTPSVKVGDKCTVCYGTGKSGDKINPCDPCKGDGIVNEGDPILLPSQVTLAAFGDLIKELKPAIKNLEEKIKSLPPKEPVKIPEEKVDESKLIPAPVEPPPLPILPQETVRKFRDITQYHMKWNMRYYTWNEERKCFIDTLGHTVSFNSILGFHPSKHKHVLMGCETGVCTRVPITRSTTRVEITPNEFGTTQESTANGGRSN